MKAAIPVPRLYVIPDGALNAFATGRSPSHAAVAVTEGLLRALDDDELEGVLAHELSHVLNRDTLTSTIAATLAGAISWLAHPFLFMGRRDDRQGDSEIGRNCSSSRDRREARRPEEQGRCPPGRAGTSRRASTW